MATASRVPSEDSLVALLGQVQYDFFGGRDGLPVGGAADVVENHACALESLVDSLLLQASQSFENGAELEIPNNSVIAEGKPRFAVPKSDEDVESARRAGVPKKTQADTKYCMRLWNEWRIHRNSTCTAIAETVPDDITQMECETLQYWMCRFVLEVRKKDGSVYLANTIHHLCCGVMRYVKECGKHELDIFRDPAFAKLRATLDSEMKRVQSLGIGTKKRQAEPLTDEEEELLWQTGQLGDHSSQTLVDTMVFMNGVYFALRSGAEHRNLRHDPPQIELVERPGERAYLKYTEDISKNHPGGLKGRKHNPEVVHHHETTNNISRCFVRLFKLYQSKCPPDRPASAFYLKPLKNPRGAYWYAVQPIGHDKLNNTVARICKAAGIQGFKTNHSLRATAATRLYHAGVDEQIIMETTGHRSLDGVCSYKRTSAQQKESISDILSMTKRFKPTDPEPESSHTPTQNKTINSPAIHSDSFQGMFSFNQCSSINVNIQFINNK